MTEGTAPGSRPRVAAAMVPAFDQVPVRVRAGTDVVARMPGALLVTRVADSDVGDRAIRAVLDLLAASGVGGDRAPGYRMSRALCDLIEAGAAPTDLVLVAATDDGLALVLAGAGVVSVSEHGWRLSCADGGLLARELDWPPAPLILALETSPEVSDHEVPEPRTAMAFDLRAGVVPGRAAVLASPPTALMSLSGTIQLGPAPLPSLQRDTTGQAAPPATTGPRRFDQILGVAPAGSPRSPLPLLVIDGETDEGTSTARVHGYRCREGHLNDPRTLFCAICGIRMSESTGVFVEGPRPPLGLLVFDNGASFSLDGDYLLGREPDVDDRVLKGLLRPLVVYDTGGVVSRRHVEIRLEEWDVLLIDCGSANGTLVAERDATYWSALVPGQPIRMLPSMQVRIGERSFVFESLHGAP
ncbi:MAG: FHA domain-containing protein [Geodermatophilaceae bacterium]|nr:FHA domain-containing protein [Geodermatophilaceae bacterium]